MSWPKRCRSFIPARRSPSVRSIENGFYYDFYREESFTPDDLAKIEERMRAIVAADKPFTKEVWSRAKAQDFFAAKGEGFKVELVDAIPEGEDVKIYRQGEWLDLCRGPHMPSTGKVGKAFKLMRLAGSYWRGDPSPRASAAHLRHRLGDGGAACRLSPSA